MSRHSLKFSLLCMVLLCVGSAGADDLGQLITSMADRARIENQGAGQSEEDIVDNDVPPDRQVVNGTVIGSGGKRLVWLNGQQVPADGGARKVTVLRDGRVLLPWREGEPARKLKPGQGLDQSTGEVFELYTRAPESVPAPTPEAMPEQVPALEEAEPAADAEPAAAVPNAAAPDKSAPAVVKDKPK